MVTGPTGQIGVTVRFPVVVASGEGLELAPVLLLKTMADHALALPKALSLVT